LNKLDWNYAIQLENKARDIIYATQLPPRISENPAFYKCKWCDKQDICHHGEVVETNCRSCKYAVPAPEGKWGCKHFNMLIPEDFIAKGCPQHLSVNE